MAEAPENGKESSNSAHAKGMNECITTLILTQTLEQKVGCVVSKHHYPDIN